LERNFTPISIACLSLTALLAGVAEAGQML
jgi:hypothetical protein